MNKLKNCNETRKLCIDNNCIICFNKSFKSVNINPIIIIDNIDSRQISKFSSLKINFKCNDCNHVFISRIFSISNGCSCPYCSIPSRLLCENNDCKSCFERSFASHEKSKFWDKNKNKTEPRFISKNSMIFFWFTCNCLHSFEKTPNCINTQNSFCPYCGNKYLCSKLDCLSCFNKSFASYPLVNKFSDKNEKKPREIFLRSDDKYLFLCNICNHDFYSRIADFKSDKLNCPYCAKKQLCENDNCLECFNNSFASHEKSKYFSLKNNIKLNKIFRCSATKYIFNCNECQSEFLTSPRNISCGNNWCSLCTNKTEEILYKWLCDKYKIENIKPQYIINKNENKQRYDFLIKNYNILIELDGGQHFSQVMNWKSPEYNLNNDINKINYAIQKNYTIIHLLQIDVFKNLNNWKTKLIDCIQEYIKPQIIIINNKNNIYSNHINKIEDINDIIII
jgi:hypothetical protein